MVRPLRDAFEHTPHAIKLLDLLTNRYHTGVVRERAATALEVEVPANMPVALGQRLRFIVAESGQGFMSRQSMHRAQVASIEPQPANRMRVYLDVLPDAA